MSNLFDAAAAFVMAENPDDKNVEVVSVSLDPTHQEGDGCSCCGMECEYDVDLDIHYTRELNDSVQDDWYRSRSTNGRTSDLLSSDDKDFFSRFVNFLADWTPNTELSNG